MAPLNDARVREILSGPDCTVPSTINKGGSILSVVVWTSFEDDVLAVNGAEGRHSSTPAPRPSAAGSPGQARINPAQARHQTQ